MNQFCRDIVDMICLCPPWCSHALGYFRACWAFLTPCLLLVSACLVLVPPGPLCGCCRGFGAALGVPARPGPLGRGVTLLLPALALQFTLIYTFLDMNNAPLRYGTYEYPGWGTSLGICMGVLTCLQVPLWALVALGRESGTLSDVSVRDGDGDGDEVGAKQGLPSAGMGWERPVMEQG